MKKYQINPTTTKNISHNIGTWQKSSKSLEIATKEQNDIGWDG
jgi:hypothetical protein